MKSKTYFIALITAGLFFIAGSPALPADFCEGNFDYDKDVDGTDSFVFKSDFGRSFLKNPCPLDGPSPVARTGQTSSYTPSDDGDLQKGIVWPNPRFTDNGDGTVADNLTGLLWLKDAECFGLRTWAEAFSDCSALGNGLCELTDGSVPGEWRLPNVNELLSLIDRSQDSPALTTGHPFIDVQSSYYWTSTTAAYNSDLAWYVYMADGFSDFDTKSIPTYVWPVRGGK